MKSKFAAAAAIAALASSAALAVPGTVKTATETKTGDVKWNRVSKEYAVTVKKGGASMTFTYALAEVVDLDVQKPANYDALVAAVERGRGAGAVLDLAGIVQGYKMLKWDKPAARWLVEAHLQANDPQKAFEAAQAIVAEEKSYAYVGDFAPAYWKVLLKLGKHQQLENCLKKAAASGDRASSANALVMRGDVIIANGGDKAETYRKALVDGYLRVALMCKDAPCAAARAVALEKCAFCFDKMGWAARAEEMRAEATRVAPSAK